MTREEMIKAIYMGYNCQGNCADVDIPCRECIEKQFAEYEKQIYNQALEDFERMIYENGYYDSFSKKITIYREDMERGISRLKEE